MTDDAFLAFVTANAPRFEIETLEKAARALHDCVASRRFGKPVGLAIGSRVAAEAFDGFWYHYGEVVRMTPKGCVIEIAGSDGEQRILYSKYSVRLLDEFEWNRAVYAGVESSKRVDESIAAEKAGYAAAADAAIKNRSKTVQMPIAVKTVDGDASVYVGAYVAAHRPDWRSYVYGVVVEFDEDACRIVDADSGYDWRVDFAKYEVVVLDEVQWQTVTAEIGRRNALVEAEKERYGKKAASKLAGKFEQTPISY
jgi:hypothetical protein